MAAYRDDVAALDARHAALSHELATKTRELAEATRLLDEAKTRARLPVLDNIRVGGGAPRRCRWLDRPREPEDRGRRAGV